MNFSSIIEIVRHDPLAVLGFLFIGFSGWAFFHVYLKLQRSGAEMPQGMPMSLLVLIPRAYLRERARYGWPTWPAYIVWISALVGFAVLVAGLFLLPG